MRQYLMVLHTSTVEYIGIKMVLHTSIVACVSIKMVLHTSSVACVSMECGVAHLYYNMRQYQMVLHTST